jgi:flagellum-specific peptidoglycan hydrolase FlgJ
MSGRKDGIKESKAIQRGNNKHRGYKRVLKDPNALVDATITGGNSLLGTVVATESGNPVTSGGSNTPTSTTSDTTGGSQASGVEQMGVFAKMGNYANNLMASIFNGKAVDMYAANTVDTSSSTSPSNGTVDISNSGSTKKAVWDFFTGMGYSKEATAGIMGNFQQESGIDPTKIQGNGKGPAAGIAQWENYNKKSARWADMNKYAQSKGKDWTDLQSQLEFVHKELEGSAPDTYTASLLKKRGGIEKLKSLTNVRDAVKMFEETFERAGKPMWENRYKYADNIYNEFANSNSAGAGGYATATSAETAPTDGSIPGSMNGWKYYKQGDPQWQKGANGRVGKQGCGMASHAMMLTTMFGKEITPVTVGEWAIKNGHWPSGMSWSMPAAIGKKFDLSMPFNVQKSNGASKADLENVKAEIKAGRPVILSGRGKSKDLNTPFTTGGHIVLAVGVDGQNRLIINDPRGPQYTKAYEDSGVMDIGVGLRGAWSFEKTGSSSIPSDWSTGSDFAAGNNGNTGNTDLSITGDGSTAAAPSIDQMGVFAKMGNFANNLMASIYNGKAVDMYAANTADTSTTPTDGTTPTPGDATWNGTQYDVSKYDMSGLSDKKLGHINKILQPALHTYKTHNLLPSVTIAQSVGESGWGPSSGLATKGNNLFGIKCGSKWTGKAYTAKTGEFLNGKNVTITDSFRAYDSMADSVIDRANFLSASRYKDMMTKNTAREQFQAMKNGGYATDPNYVNKMMQIVNDSKLTRFDSPKPPVEVSGGDAGKGDDETVWADGFGPSTKPVKVRRTSNSSMNGSNVNINTDSQRKVDSLGREINATVNYNMSAAAPGTNNTDYRTILRAIMEQLQYINSNTAETARGVNNIEIVSANEPISGSTPGSKSPKKSIDNRQANSNTGYDIARKLASYK